nr:MAG TPA: AntA/AntB antirepressor [Bacteriophage sp.]
MHEELNIKTRFNYWFSRMCEYGFSDGLDFYSKMSKTKNAGRTPMDR